MQIRVADGKRGKARASESRLVVVLLSSYWIKKWRDFFFKPIAWLGNARPKCLQMTFDGQMKTALLV